MYAADIENEGRTYAPAFMREAAKRLARQLSSEPADERPPVGAAAKPGVGK
jgi:hypothetical protein